MLAYGTNNKNENNMKVENNKEKEIFRYKRP